MNSKLMNAITFESLPLGCKTDWKGEQADNYWGRPVRGTAIKIYQAHVGYIVENLQTEQEWDNPEPYVNRFEIHINHMYDPKKWPTSYANTYQEAVNFAREALGFPVDEAAQDMEDARHLGWDLSDIATEFQRMIAYLALDDGDGCKGDEGPAADVVMQDPSKALQNARIELNRLKMIIRDQRQAIRDLEGR